MEVVMRKINKRTLASMIRMATRRVGEGKSWDQAIATALGLWSGKLPPRGAFLVDYRLALRHELKPRTIEEAGGIEVAARMYTAIAREHPGMRGRDIAQIVIARLRLDVSRRQLWALVTEFVRRERAREQTERAAETEELLRDRFGATEAANQPTIASVGITTVACRYAEAMARSWTPNADLGFAQQVRDQLNLAEPPAAIRQAVDSFFAEVEAQARAFGPGEEDAST